LYIVAVCTLSQCVHCLVFVQFCFSDFGMLVSDVHRLFVIALLVHVSKFRFRVIFLYRTQQFTHVFGSNISWFEQSLTSIQCSCLVQAVCKSFGLSMHRQARQQFKSQKMKERKAKQKLFEFAHEFSKVWSKLEDKAEQSAALDIRLDGLEESINTLKEERDSLQEQVKKMSAELDLLKNGIAKRQESVKSSPSQMSSESFWNQVR